MQFKKSILALAIASTTLAGCLGGGNSNFVAEGDVYVLSDANQLTTLNRTTPGSVQTTATLSGFQTSSEQAIGMDIRPFNGKIYVVTKDSTNVGRVYTVNARSGALSFVAQLAADTAGDSPTNPANGAPTQNSPLYTALSGTKFGVDFNPAADALRVVSDTGQNLRIFVDNDRRNKVAGLTITDGVLTDGNNATPTAAAGTSVFKATAAAYTNSFDGTSTTRLFDLDATNNRLLLQNSANDGYLLNQGPLLASGTITSANEFDIDPENNVGYAVLTVNGTQALYSVKIPGTGDTAPLDGPLATSLGSISMTGNVVGVAVKLNPNPVVTGLTGTAIAPSLISFSARSPSSLTSTLNVTGLTTGDELLSIDYRPANGKLYGLVRNGTDGKVVVIDPANGSVSSSKTITQSSANFVFSTVKSFNIDFNPAVDKLRVVSAGGGSAGDSYVVDVDTGVITPNANALVSAMGSTNDATNIQQLAYTNSFASTIRPTTSTALFDIDATNNKLVLQNTTTSALTDVGLLGGGLLSYGGFDVAGGDNGARLLAARTSGSGPFTLFDVSLSTGAAAAVGSTANSTALSSGATAVIGGTSGPADLRDIAIRYSGNR